MYKLGLRFLNFQFVTIMTTMKLLSAPRVSPSVRKVVIIAEARLVEAKATAFAPERKEIVAARPFVKPRRIIRTRIKIISGHELNFNFLTDKNPIRRKNDRQRSRLAIRHRKQKQDRESERDNCSKNFSVVERF